MRSLNAALLGLFLVITVTGCSENNKAKPPTPPVNGANPTTSTPASPATKDALEAPPAPEPAVVKLSDPLRAIVKETMNSGGYTYVLVTVGQNDLWAAGTAFPVAVGDEVQLEGLMPMYRFHSATLDRTFDVIQFVGRAGVVGGTKTDKPKAPSSMGELPKGHPSIGDAAKPAKPDPATPPKAGEIEKLADGITVAELFEKSKDLASKVVKFRGRVVKANSGILGLNWLHIQDGSGAAGTNDITVTSADGYAAPGSLVVIEGTLGLNRDFGAGYSYEVIVEEAKVTVEP